ncbi:hypothetical protein PP740_gp069 [Stenotrophomonas phage Philippe]|uniref:Membrane protein n=1 Tax=Stenotrophomonas phage Philippe TaxID=2859655 RepID=A0AAE7WPX8_9CAUD|nr:hypothetical protein PP740_gp069 [Stenotrophomonas phage Philippe]QYW02273.1 putative membrane protein [Stenotrophomonas phage Philippe]
MGLFSSKKTYVSSTAYNMAGDIKDRPDFLKSAVVGAVTSGQNISNVLTDSYLGGPGVKLRSFFNWAERNNYADVVGQVEGALTVGTSVNYQTIKDHLGTQLGTDIEITSAVTGAPDYTYWADQWVLENYPERVGTEYVSDYLQDSNTITIKWADESESSFQPSQPIDPVGSYLYIVFTRLIAASNDPVVTGDTVTLEETDEWPDTTGWTLQTDVTDPNGDTHKVYVRTTFKGAAEEGSNLTYSLREWMYQDTVEDVRTYRIDSQKRYQSSITAPEIMIYQKGTGDAVLDEMFTPASTQDHFFPFIPFRIDNKFVSETNMPTVYEASKKAYYRATGSNYDRMIKTLADNENLDDIDFAYLVFGVSLNTKENTSRKYIYKFFKTIYDNAMDGSGTAEYNAWKLEWDAAKESWDTWTKWKEAQSNSADPLFGTPEPVRKAYPVMPNNKMRIASDKNTVMNYDITIGWNTILETTGSGKLKPDAKRDEVWFTSEPVEEFDQIIWAQDSNGMWSSMLGGKIVNSVIVMNWQDGDNSWRRLRIVGLNHENLIYNGKSVFINSKEAMEDDEESGFLIPLHPQLYKDMGMRDGTQMATACVYTLFNSYQVVKKKWYQTGAFKVVLIIVIIIITIVTYGGGAAAGGGILGSNAAVGASLGFTGTAAVVAGAIANAVAAMVVANMIQRGAVALFGEKVGAIVGAIASVIALQVGTAVANGQNISTAMSGMMRAENILRLTNALGEGYAGYVQASMKELQAQQEILMSDYDKQMKQIADQWESTFGTNNGIINPAAVTNAFNVTYEEMDTFLQRTLMMGSDVGDLSFNLLYDFTEITLRPPNTI